MRKFIITSIIFIITLLSACGKKENPIEILKPTEIEQKTSGSYKIETIDFNIGERNIDDINYSLKGIISIPKESKQKKLKLKVEFPKNHHYFSIFLRTILDIFAQACKSIQ